MLPGAKASRLLRLVLYHEKSLEPLKEGKQMNVNPNSTCAPSERSIDWHSINWAKCHANVRRLQKRIVKATQQGRWGKVKALQRLLVTSFSGKALAVKRVTENQGKKTPGVDKETWSTPKDKTKGILSLRQHGHKPSPLRRVYIPKANGKKRPLGIPMVRSHCTSYNRVGDCGGS